MASEGHAVEVRRLDDGFVELRFDLPGESVNKLDGRTRGELAAAVAGLHADHGVRGVLITSGKDSFIAGADVTEFPRLFHEDEETIARWMLETDGLFSRIEDLELPSVAAINGVALGGGFELCLAASFRVLS